MINLFGNKEKGLLEKLKNKNYKNLKEKLEIIKELEEVELDPFECIWMLKDIDNDIRNLGVKKVSKNRSQRILEILIKEVKKDYKIGKRYIIPFIAKIQPVGLNEYLRKYIISHDIIERKIAIEIASCFYRIDKYFYIFEEALNDPEEEIKYKAITKLAPYISKRKDVFLMLLPILNDNSSQIRELIIDNMLKLDSPDIIEPLLTRVPYESQVIRDRIINKIGRMAQNPKYNIKGKIIPLLASDNKICREVAAKLLAKIPNKKEVLREFLIYLRGIACWLRDRIFESMRLIAHEIGEEVLELLRDENKEIRIDTMFLASYINDSRIIPGVLEILNDENMDWWVKNCAIEILTKFKVKDLDKILEKYENDSDLILSIISSYGEIKAKSKLEFLKNYYFKTNSRYVKLEVVRSIYKIGGKESLEILKEIYRKNDDSVIDNEIKSIFGSEKMIINNEKVDNIIKDKERDKSVNIQMLMKIGLEMEDENLNQEIREKYLKDKETKEFKILDNNRVIENKNIEDKEASQKELTQKEMLDLFHKKFKTLKFKKK